MPGAGGSVVAGPSGEGDAEDDADDDDGGDATLRHLRVGDIVRLRRCRGPGAPSASFSPLFSSSSSSEGAAQSTACKVSGSGTSGGFSPFLTTRGIGTSPHEGSKLMNSPPDPSGARAGTATTPTAGLAESG